MIRTLLLTALLAAPAAAEFDPYPDQVLQEHAEQWGERQAKVRTPKPHRVTHALAALDVATTCYGLHQGLREANPIVGSGSDACLRGAVLNGLIQWFVFERPYRRAMRKGRRPPPRGYPAIFAIRSAVIASNLATILD